MSSARRNGPESHCVQDLEVLDLADAWLAGEPEVRRGHMFGHPAYYIARRMFACIYQGGLGLRLPATMAAAALQDVPGCAPFRPYGRARMKEWIHVGIPLPRETAELLRAACRDARQRSTVSI